MKNLFVFVMALVMIAGLCLGVYWLLWQLWCWVVPQLWASGPANLVRPDFWLFAGAWFLLSLAGKAMFGRSDK